MLIHIAKLSRWKMITFSHFPQTPRATIYMFNIVKTFNGAKIGPITQTDRIKNYFSK